MFRQILEPKLIHKCKWMQWMHTPQLVYQILCLYLVAVVFQGFFISLGIHPFLVNFKILLFRGACKQSTQYFVCHFLSQCYERLFDGITPQPDIDFLEEYFDDNLVPTGTKTNRIAEKR